MLRVKSLTINVVADVTGFLDLSSISCENSEPGCLMKTPWLLVEVGSDAQQLSPIALDLARTTCWSSARLPEKLNGPAF
jgi:hypothetical protein